MEPRISLSREELRNHRRSIQMALDSYAKFIAEHMEIELSTVRIVSFVDSTHILVHKSMVPTEFIEETDRRNGKKKFFYHVEFSGKYVSVKIPGKPLITEGQGILLFFFRELLQFLDKKAHKKHEQARLWSACARLDRPALE
ncbi:MAG TPA: hypothetical protein VF817_05215 [Patescibacteria group bacterium]